MRNGRSTAVRGSGKRATPNTKAGPARSRKRLPTHDVVGALYAEHRYAAQLLDVLEEQLDRLSRGQPLDRESSLAVMAYMTQHLDAYHHQREGAMFVRLAKRDPHLAKLIAEVERAHRTIGSAGKLLLAALKRLPQDGLVVKAGVATRIGDYVSAMREHMAIEERDLFPRARQILDDHDLAEIDRAFTRVIDPIFEASLRDAYAAYSPVVRYLAEQPAFQQAIGALDRFYESALTLGETLFGWGTGEAPSVPKPARGEGARRASR